MRHGILSEKPGFHLLSTLARVLSSPVTFYTLLLVGITFILIFYRTEMARQAPQVAGLDWSQHSEALMIVYPLADACSSCNLSIAGWTELGLKNNLDIVVLAAKQTEELKQLPLIYPGHNLSIITDVMPETIKRFSVGDKIGGARIQKGRIIHYQLGGTPAKAFFTHTH